MYHVVPVALTQVCCCSRKAAVEKYIDEGALLCFNEALFWRLKFEFHIVFMCHKILVFF
jgi:hypothetical protein